MPARLGLHYPLHTDQATTTSSSITVQRSQALTIRCPRRLRILVAPLQWSQALTVCSPLQPRTQVVPTPPLQDQVHGRHSLLLDGGRCCNDLRWFTSRHVIPSVHSLEGEAAELDSPRASHSLASLGCREGASHGRYGSCRYVPHCSYASRVPSTRLARWIGDDLVSRPSPRLRPIGRLAADLPWLDRRCGCRHGVKWYRGMVRRHGRLAPATATESGGTAATFTDLDDSLPTAATESGGTTTEPAGPSAVASHINRRDNNDHAAGGV